MLCSQLHLISCFEKDAMRTNLQIDYWRSWGFSKEQRRNFAQSEKLSLVNTYLFHIKEEKINRGLSASVVEPRFYISEVTKNQKRETCVVHWEAYRKTHAEKQNIQIWLEAEHKKIHVGNLSRVNLFSSSSYFASQMSREKLKDYDYVKNKNTKGTCRVT